MGKIGDTTFRDWNTGETMGADDYEKEREIIRTAINDNDTRVGDVEGKTTNLNTDGSDFKGTWQGYKPTEVEPSVSGALDALLDRVNWISVKEYGATGDGVTDDTVAIQDAIDYAYNNNYAGVIFPKSSVKYLISDTIRLYSGQTYWGEGTGQTTIEQISVDKPVMASDNYYGNYSPTGRMIIKDLTITGDTTKINNHGLLVRDYYTTISNVMVSSVGGDGIKLTHLDSAGTSVSGSLVENRIIDCETRNTSGYNYYLGDADNNKITDGFMINCIASANSSTPAHVYCGSSAGWRFDGIHAYGSAPTNSIHLLNLYHTRIGNIYIESFLDDGLQLDRIQSSVNIDKVSIKCGGANANGKAISLAKSSLVSSANINIDNVHIVQDTATSVYGIYTGTGTLTIKTGTMQFSGDNVGSITKYSSPDMSKIKRIEDAVIEGSLRDSANNNTLLYNGVPVPHTDNSSRVTGNSAQSVTFDVSDIPDYTKIIGTISIMASAYDNGSKRAEWLGHVMVSAKSSTDAWTPYTTSVVAASGFATGGEPSVTVDKAAKTVTVSFTFLDADAAGVVGFVYAPTI